MTGDGLEAPVGAEVVVAGGGPAGASAAWRLARAGRAVLLLERDPAPRDKICGEFLSIEGQEELRALGLDPAALGAAPIASVRLVHERSVAEADLPFQGVGLTRRALDEALLNQAEAAGVAVRRGVPVRGIEARGGGLRVRTAVGAVAAPTLFLATGKHDLRGIARPAGPEADGLVGFKTYFRLAADQQAALEGRIEIVLFDGGYAGLQLVEGGRANLCLLARGDLLARVGRDWAGLRTHLLDTCPHLAERLGGAVELMERPLAISRVPYGFVHRPGPDDPPGLFRLGDQMGVIPSFAGDGMAIALHTGRLAAETWLAGGGAGAFHARARRDVLPPVRLASLLYRLSRARTGRRLVVGVGRIWPGAMRAAARATRVAPLSG